jgi:hypothetical protein
VRRFVANSSSANSSENGNKTVFTFAVLDEFLLQNLECKTSAQNFYSKLRRTTSKAFLEIVPDRYWELLRISRQWRYLKYQKWHGLGHDLHSDDSDMNILAAEGSMAIFCPTCLQPGINLPDDWMTLPEKYVLHLASVIT